MPTNTAHKVPANTSQSKTAETKIKKDKEIKPAVRIQQLKNNLIILGHELKVNKKINDSLQGRAGARAGASAIWL